MRRESGIRQRAIVGQRLALADTELITKYTLPFVDATWNVAFVVLDLVGSPPWILDGPIHSDGSRLRSSEPGSSLRRIEAIPLENFVPLVHYDPWWAFRGVSGVDRRWIETVFATNIARPFDDGGKRLKIHDLEFDDGLRRLRAVLAKDELFRTTEFHSGDLDLLRLRGKSRAPSADARLSPTAKVL